jgi:FkbM family methyltransferase
MKLARFTRKFSRYENPFAYRLVRKVVKRVYPIKQPHSSLRTVIDYDEGLINVDTRLLSEYKILFFNNYEVTITRLIKHVVKPGDLCLDIGANVGAVTLVMAFATGGEGKIIAIEPHPTMVDRLRANIELNRLDNVSVIAAALSNTEGKAVLYTAEEHHFHQGLSSLKPSQGITREIPIEKITGKMLQERIGDQLCSFIKIDVEGHDFIVLTGLADIVAKHRPHMIFEYHRNRWLDHDCRIEQAVEFLRDYKYRIYFIKHDLIFPLESEVPDSCDVFCSPKMD